MPFVTTIAAATRRLLDDPSFPQRSRHLAARITSDAHSTTAVDQPVRAANGLAMY
ncbi:hypothetical protein GCM10023215_55990 [Pseudonocardia yuanmonensis]|uniref:Uncharacterized protein n=1 Tax=Pseudonocardia yuanmonensis TaxID=1095914 RepID=A0ABP8XJW5_9PSEU